MPVHTKDDNYDDNDKDIVLKIILYVKRVHTTTITLTAQRNNIIGNTFRMTFFQLMNDKNIDSQSESILL